MSACDLNGNTSDIGNVKIGFRGQTEDTSTYTKLPESFEQLPSEFFSLGQDVDFYKKIAALPADIGKFILTGLRDIVAAPEVIPQIDNERVFSVSLLREVSLSLIKGQFQRVLAGRPALTDFKFKFASPGTVTEGPVDLSFKVVAESTPSSNIHAIIGRNGVGKTRILNGMIDAITMKRGRARFMNTEGWESSEIAEDFFSGLVSVSFSAFDPFNPPREQSDPAKGTCYFYVGLKDPHNAERHLTVSELQRDCAKSLIKCFLHQGKTSRWLHAINKLGSDGNFTSMKLDQLNSLFQELRATRPEQPDSETFIDEFFSKIKSVLDGMSSGHAIVLLTITRLVATVDEKTLVLLDEPESHLHPPLLSALVRALADLLHEQNGVGIIATHSPVVLQEIPRSCVWKVHRVGMSLSSTRPEIETFGENVGLLTSEVFSLEVARSGFHALLAQSVAQGKDYDSTLREYSSQLGFEGRAILKALIASRDREQAK